MPGEVKLLVPALYGDIPQVVRRRAWCFEHYPSTTWEVYHGRLPNRCRRGGFYASIDGRALIAKSIISWHRSYSSCRYILRNRVESVESRHTHIVTYFGEPLDPDPLVQ